MGFQDRGSTRIAELKPQIEARRIIVIACEDENIQPSYFNKICETFDIPTITEVTIVPCRDGKSALGHICDNLKDYFDNYKETKGLDERDEFWIVIDREDPKHNNNCKERLVEKIKECQNFSSYFKIGIVNPLFELWLLLHIVDIGDYDKTKLLSNEKISKRSKRRFIDKELSNILGGYNKSIDTSISVMKKIVTKENLDRALKQESSLKTDIDGILDNLGSNIGNLIKSIFTE